MDDEEVVILRVDLDEELEELVILQADMDYWF